MYFNQFLIYKSTHAVEAQPTKEQIGIISKHNHVTNIRHEYNDFMYKINKRGPTMEPCGTPHLTVFPIRLH